MRALLHVTRTGMPVMDLQISGWSYDCGINTPDKHEVTLPAYTQWAHGVDLQELLTPYKYSIALIDDSVEGHPVVVSSGPIVSRLPEDDVDGNISFKVTCRGPQILFNFWQIRAFPGWPLLDAEGKPTGVYDMTFTGLEYGTIIKKLVQERAKWAGNELPLLFEADRPGSREYAKHEAVDGKRLLDALDDIADLVNGVEWALIPQINELDQVSYLLATGTDSTQIIARQDSLTWNLGGAVPDIRNFAPNDLVGEVATDAIFSAGKGEDKVLLAQASDPALVDAGWPRLEVWDSSHSSITEQTTLQAYADGRVTDVASRPSFQVRADRAHGLRFGDVVEIASLGHWYCPDGVTVHRALAVGRKSSDPDWVDVQLV